MQGARNPRFLSSYRLYMYKRIRTSAAIEYPEANISSCDPSRMNGFLEYSLFLQLYLLARYFSSLLRSQSSNSYLIFFLVYTIKGLLLNS
jgi:hypothetical protein